MSSRSDEYPYYPYSLSYNYLPEGNPAPFSVVHLVTNVAVAQTKTNEEALAVIASELSKSLDAAKRNSIYHNNTGATLQPPLLFRLQRLGELLEESLVEASADDEFEILTRAAQIILRWRLGHERNLNHLKVKDELTKHGIKVRGDFGYKQDLPLDPNSISGVTNG